MGGGDNGFGIGLLGVTSHKSVTFPKRSSMSPKSPDRAPFALRAHAAPSGEYNYYVRAHAAPSGECNYYVQAHAAPSGECNYYVCVFIGRKIFAGKNICRYIIAMY